MYLKSIELQGFKSFIGELENAKCKMQNAKCKMNEAFCFAKASLMVTCGNLHPQKSYGH